jgi:hypothetical protein
MANSLITEEKEEILKYFKELAREVDFSSLFISTSSPSKPIHEAATLLSVESDSGKLKKRNERKFRLASMMTNAGRFRCLDRSIS